MDLKVTKQPVPINEIIFDGQAQQGVEFDYTLPDYYPNIFKILRCTLKPNIISYALDGNKLSCDGVIIISALYLGEGSNNINCIEHRYTFSKIVDLPKEADDPIIYIIPKSDYCTCRAVSDRRIDVRGAIGMKIRVSAVKTADIITGAEGLGVRTACVPIRCSGNRITFQKQFAVSEEIDAGRLDGTVRSVICCDSTASVNECKVVADKIVVKGEAALNASYIYEKDDKTYIGNFTADIPVSQIADVNGITEKHICCCELGVMSCELQTQHEGTDECVFSCDLIMQLTLISETDEMISPVKDLYSTDYECEFSKTNVKLSSQPMSIMQTAVIKEKIKISPDASSIEDCRCELSDVNIRSEDDSTLFCGKAVYRIISSDVDGTPTFTEHSSSFEIPIKNERDNMVFEPFIKVGGCDYSFDKDGNADIRVSVSISGYCYLQSSEDTISDISVLTDRPKERNEEYCLKLYYAEKNENIWDIAKRYNTSAELISDENGLESNVIDGGMILIPLL